MSCGGFATTVKNRLSVAPNLTTVQVELVKKVTEITSSQTIKANNLQDVLKNTDYTISELINRKTL